MESIEYFGNIYYAQNSQEDGDDEDDPPSPIRFPLLFDCPPIKYLCGKS